MLLQFPTGSGEDQADLEDDSVHACIYFLGDASWKFILTPGANETTAERITDTVKFFMYALKDKDLIREFRDHEDKSQNEKIEDWRRENIKLVWIKKE
tara:strand:- start:58 stop:351 length:294 start_codon:yes stop_codon:yes gene_type:complete